MFCFVSFYFTSIYYILISLSLASFGMAMLEPTTESYFLNIVKRNEAARFFGPYNTNANVLSFIGKIIASSLLLIFPFKSLFLLFGAFMFFFFLISLKTKEI